MEVYVQNVRPMYKKYKETNNRFLVMVPDRSIATLMCEVHEHIKHGTFILSDSWKGYQTL